MNAKISLEIPEEIQIILLENGIDIQEILDSNSIDAKVERVINNTDDITVKDKDATTIILASSVLVYSISFAISKIIKTIYSKPFLTEIEEWETVRDKNGKVVLDNGKPLSKMVKKYHLLQPEEQNTKSGVEVDFKPNNGIKIKFISQENKPN